MTAMSFELGDRGRHPASSCSFRGCPLPGGRPPRDYRSDRRDVVIARRSRGAASVRVHGEVRAVHLPRVGRVRGCMRAGLLTTAPSSRPFSIGGETLVIGELLSPRLATGDSQSALLNDAHRRLREMGGPAFDVLESGGGCGHWPRANTFGCRGRGRLEPADSAELRVSAWPPAPADLAAALRPARQPSQDWWPPRRRPSGRAWRAPESASGPAADGDGGGRQSWRHGP